MTAPLTSDKARAAEIWINRQMSPTLGAQAMTIPASVLEAFARDGAPGARITYAQGRDEPRTAATWLLAGELAQAGWLRLFRQRTPGGFEFLAEKRDRGDIGAAAPRAVMPDAADDALLAMLRRAANFDQPCPTNVEIAAALNLKDAVAASYRMRKLIQLGAIRVTDHGPKERREVTIAETGKSTPRGKL